MTDSLSKQWEEAMRRGDHATAQALEPEMGPVGRNVFPLFHDPRIADRGFPIEGPIPKDLEEEFGRRMGRAYREFREFIAANPISSTRPSE